MRKPLRFHESEYFMWHERRQGLAQAHRAMGLREHERQIIHGGLWIVGLPGVVALACWLGEVFS